MKKLKLKDCLCYLNQNKTHMSDWALKLLIDTERRIDEEEFISAKQYAKVVQEAKNVFIEKNISEFTEELMK